MAVITGSLAVLDGNGDPSEVQKYAPGRAAAAASGPVVLSTEDLAAINALGTLLTAIDAGIPAALGQGTKSASMSVSIASDQGEIGKSYTGMFEVAGATLTRPANTTQYTANDSISNNGTAASVTALSSNNLSDTNDAPFDLTEIVLDTSDTGPGSAGIPIRIHLFNSDPTASSGVGAGDNAAYSNKKAGWFGSFSGVMRAFSDGSRGVLIADEGTVRLVKPASGARNIWYQLQTLAQFNPSANSTTWIPTFKGFQGRIA